MKQKIMLVAAGVLAGYMLVNYLDKVPVVNKLPKLGAPKA